MDVGVGDEQARGAGLSKPGIGDSRLGQAITFIILSIGRLIALAVLTALMLFVLLLVAYLVFPDQAFSTFFGASPDFPFAKPTLRDTLATACATFFVITLLLWVFDGLDLFPFRHPWMSKAVWGTGIASIISTSVLVYSQVVGPQQQDLDGIWQARVDYVFDAQMTRKDHLVIMTYDPDSSTYVAQSDVNGDYWLSFRLNPKTSEAVVTMAGPDVMLGPSTFRTQRTSERDRAFRRAKVSRRKA